MPKQHKLKWPEESILSLILVTQNDEDIITERLALINQTLSSLNNHYEIIVIDNASEDATVAKITQMSRLMRNARILVLSKPYEKGVAITAGIDICIGDYAIVFDLYTDPVEMIPYLVTNRLIKGNDIVVGKSSRYVVEYDLLSKFFLYAIEKLSKRGFFYRQNYLMGLSRKAINSIIRTRRKSRTEKS